MASKSKKLSKPEAGPRYWHHFMIIEHSAVLMASFAQSDKRFHVLNNLQGSATCIVAACMLHIIKVELWTDEVLNSILTIGANLYEASLRRIKQILTQFAKQQTPLIPISIGPLELNRDFFMVQDYRMLTRIDLLCSENIDLNETPVLQLQVMLATYFLDRFETQILQVLDSDRVKKQNRNYAFWQAKRDFFLFNPDDQPVATLIRFTEYDLFVLTLFRYICNIDIVQDLDTSLLPFKTVKLYSCIVERVDKFDRTPPDLAEIESEMMIAPKVKIGPIEDIITRTPLAATPPTKQRTPPTPPTFKVERPKVMPTFKPKFSSSPIKVAASELPSMAAEQEELKEPVVLKRSPLKLADFYQHVDYPVHGILCDPDFYNEGYQRSFLLSISIAALIMLNVVKSKLWNNRIITDILQLGRTIYYQSLIHNDKTDVDDPNIHRIRLYNKQYLPKMMPGLIYGRIITLSGEDGVIDLLQGLRIHFQYNDMGILNGPLTVAIWREEECYYMFDPNTNACCLKFDYLELIARLYRRHIEDEDDLFSFFFITNWMIIEYEEIVDEDSHVIPFDNWFQFSLITNQRWILRSRFCQNDRIFPSESRNQQCVAMATIAIICRFFVPLEDWDQDLMDIILVRGDEYYREVVQYLKDNNKFHSNLLMVDELLRDLEVMNKLVHLEIEDCCIYGLIDDEHINRNNDNNETASRAIGLTLKQGLYEFFKNNQKAMGILTAQHQSFAIWQYGTNYFYFDSHRRNKNGHIIIGYDENQTMNDSSGDSDNGKACCIRHLSINSLLQTILTNLNLQQQGVIYNLSSIKVHPIKDLTTDLYEVDLTNFRQIDDHLYILQHPTICIDDGCKHLIPTALIMALSWTILLPMDKWTEYILGVIYNLTQLNYIRSYNNLDIDDTDNQVTVEKVLKQFQIGINEIEVKRIEEISTGLLANKLEDDLNLFFDNIQQLEESLLIFQTDLIELCLWKDPATHLYFLYDPYGRDDNGHLYIKGDVDYSHLCDVGEDAVLPEGFQFPDDDTDLTSYRRLELSIEARLKSYGIIEEELVHERRMCVLCFDNIVGLVYNLIYNTPSRNYCTLEYRLKHVELENRLHVDDLLPSESMDWCGFKFVKETYWILRGRVTLNDQIYTVENRGKQAIPCCFVLIAFIAMYRLEKFNIDTIDSIMNYGDRLFTYKLKSKYLELRERLYNLSFETIELMVKQQLQQQHDYLIDDFNKKFCIDHNEVDLDFILEYYTGDVYLDDIETQQVNNRVYTNLRRALELLFETRKFGILHCKLKYVVVFRLEGFYYMFDPYNRGPDGLPSQPGCACITRYENLEDLCQLYRRTLPEVGLNQYHLTIVEKLVITECQRKYRQSIKLKKDDILAAMAAGYNHIDRQPPDEDQDRVNCFNRTMPLENFRWILRGQRKYLTLGTSQVHHAGCTIVYIALTMNLLQKTQIWPDFMIDEIIISGQELYAELYKKFFIQPWEKKLNVYSVHDQIFRLGLARVCCQCCLIETTGYVVLDEEEQLAMNLFNQPPTLRQALEDFFANNSHGILQLHNLVLAIWEEYDEDDILNQTKQYPYLYLFDPNMRNEIGLPVRRDGRPCCLKFINLDLLANHITEVLKIMLSLSFNDKTRFPFIITPIDIYIDDTCYTTSVKQKFLYRGEKIDRIPPKLFCQNYQRIFMSDEQWKCQYGAEFEQKKRDLQKMENLGRLKYHQVLMDVWLIRSTEPLEREVFDLPTTIACLLYFNHFARPTKWAASELDQIIMIGELLYYDSALNFVDGDPDLDLTRERNQQDQDQNGGDIEEFNRLRLSQIVREIYIKDKLYRLVIYVPFNCGHFNFDNVLKRFRAFFEFMTTFLLRINNKWAAIFKHENYYYYFDPYERDLAGNRAPDGYPIVMKFLQLDQLVEQLVRVFQPLDSNDADWDFRIVDIDTEECEIPKESE